METLEKSQPFLMEARKQNDIETLFAECLDGVMRTPFEYQYDQQSDTLHAEDGGDVDAIFHNAYEDICRVVEQNPNAQFDKRRVETELGELEDMHAMMQGELPNTMIVVSDFPEELIDYPTDYRGYNVTRKQTMLRVLVRDGETLRMYSQSLDQSDRKGLEALYYHFGLQPQEGELLGQRMHLDVDATRQHTLVDELQYVYDSEMQRQSGKRYSAGREVYGHERQLNTYDFVREQRDIISLAVSEVLANTFSEEKQYGTIALLQERYEQALHSIEPINYVLSDAMNYSQFVVNYAVLDAQRQMAGLTAQRQQKTFSGCGMTMNSKDPLDGKTQLEASGYTVDGSEKDEETEKWSYNLVDYCRECQAPPKKGDDKKKVGPCKICEDCVNTNHGGKK